MVAASTVIERQTFYWVGSNQAMINAGFSQVPAGATVGYGFSGPWGYQASFGTLFPTTATGDVYWGDKNNWMVKVRGATLTTSYDPNASSTGGFSGGSSAGVNLDSISSSGQLGYYWKPATRIPHRGDTVIFKYIPANHVAGLTFTAPLSPCLFGGRGNSGGYMWIGDLAGGMTTGNANAIGPVRKIIVDRTYFEMGGTGGMAQGKVPYSGFKFGIPNYITGATGDGILFNGINIYSQFVDIHGPGITTPGLNNSINWTDPHGIYINDLENCGEVNTNTMNLVIYGGTCDNLRLGSHISTGLTQWGFGSSAIESPTNTIRNTGYIELNTSVLGTIRMTPTLWNSRTIINDAGGSCTNFVYGPHTTSGRCRVAYYTPSVGTIEIKPTAFAKDTIISEDQYWSVEDGAAAIESGSLNSRARWFRNACALHVGGFTGAPVGGFESNERVSIGTLKFNSQNEFDGYADTVTTHSTPDYYSFNNAFAANSGMTISNIELFDGAFTIGREHDGGNTFDFGFENQAIAISAGFIGRGGHLDMKHQLTDDFANVFVGDPSSSDPNRGLLVFGAGLDSLITFAPTQFAKLGPPTSGETGAAATSTERSRTVRRTLPSRD